MDLDIVKQNMDVKDDKTRTLHGTKKTNKQNLNGSKKEQEKFIG